tara:strand:+ start:1469 stop:2026 length:558 start_codon:yes stop_codon:yes gene_type:complete
MIFIWILLLAFIFSSCSEDKVLPINPPADISDSNNSNIEVEIRSRFSSNDRTEEEILNDFPKPIRAYPLIEKDDVEILNGGILYRKNIDRPFTGRMLEKYADGSIALESSYLDGLPHGQQLRRFENGKPALEAVFDQGVLSGVKTKWWENGKIREEEYWSEGEFFGRRLWDQDGRMIREELVPQE